LKERKILLGKLLLTSFMKTVRKVNIMVVNDVSLFYQFDEDQMPGIDRLDEG